MSNVTVVDEPKNDNSSGKYVWWQVSGANMALYAYTTLKDEHIPKTGSTIYKISGASNPPTKDCKAFVKVSVRGYVMTTARTQWSGYENVIPSSYQAKAVASIVPDPICSELESTSASSTKLETLHVKFKGKEYDFPIKTQGGPDSHIANFRQCEKTFDLTSAGLTVTVISQGILSTASHWSVGHGCAIAEIQILHNVSIEAYWECGKSKERYYAFGYNTYTAWGSEKSRGSTASTAAVSKRRGSTGAGQQAMVKSMIEPTVGQKELDDLRHDMSIYRLIPFEERYLVLLQNARGERNLGFRSFAFGKSVTELLSEQEEERLLIASRQQRLRRLLEKLEITPEILDELSDD